MAILPSCQNVDDPLNIGRKMGGMTHRRPCDPLAVGKSLGIMGSSLWQQMTVSHRYLLMKIEILWERTIEGDVDNLPSAYSAP